MSKPVGNGAVAPDRGSEVEDRAAVSVAAAMAAISGFLMGLFLQGEVATGALVTVLVPAACLAGWWCRGVVHGGPRAEIERRGEPAAPEGAPPPPTMGYPLL